MPTEDEWGEPAPPAGAVPNPRPGRESAAPRGEPPIDGRHDSAPSVHTVPPLPAGQDSFATVYPPANESDAAPPWGEGPTLLGRYEVRQELGRGGMCSVYLCHDRSLGRDLAVKVLKPSFQFSEGLRRRFAHEARISAQLQHPGIAPVYDFGTLPDGHPYLAMKLIRGRTLAELLAERPSPRHGLDRFLAVFLSAAQVLAYAHSRGVVHRDPKPGNVMVGAFGEVQVIDWGLAKVLSPDAEESSGPPTGGGGSPNDRPLPAGEPDSEHGRPMGTPAYMSPEQARGERVDRRSDVFGLGAVLCQILTGSPPYGEPGQTGWLRAACEGRLETGLARLAACAADEELVDLAKRCLAVCPADRPADAGAVAEAMSEYLTGLRDRLRRAELRHAASRRTAEVRRLKAGLLVTFVLGLCCGVALALAWF